MSKPMNTNLLIREVTPLYNRYVRDRSAISGTDALEIMWDIGDILKKFINENSIAPHALFWEVYGKSEGKNNIAQKSYITREFQNRCHRIRNIFSTKAQIRKELPNLKKFTTFREAMPFFDNKKYKLQGKEKEKLLTLLNSDEEYKSIMQEINKLQKEKIGIKNPRTQRLKELEREKDVFISFYNLIYRLRSEAPEKTTLKLKKNNINSRYIATLAKNTNALSQDGLKFTQFSISKNIQDPLWIDYGKIIQDFSSHRNAVTTRRFRRVIASERIVRLADMLYSLI